MSRLIRTIAALLFVVGHLALLTTCAAQPLLASRAVARLGLGWVCAVSGLLAVCGLVALVAWFRSARLRESHERAVAAVASRLDACAGSLTWIVVASGLSLFVELAVIRWSGALLPGLAAYRNFGLLACFLGLSIGFVSGRRSVALVPYALPLLGLHFASVSLVELFSSAGKLWLWTALGSPYWQFACIVVTTIPAGQLVGRLLAQESTLRGYGANLAGSIAGVVAINVLSALWTPPTVWLGLTALLFLALFAGRGFAVAATAGLAVLGGLAAPCTPAPSFEIYSPYQRILLRPQGIGHDIGAGRTAIYANGNYYQSFAAVDTRRLRPEADVQHLIPNADLGLLAGRLQGRSVLALGTGAGSNLPALLRAGVSRVVAVDIDPVIVHLGRRLNANQPYADPRVEVVVDDARAYLRRSREQFDYVFFFWIDSHPGSSTSAGFRVDSFVYTQECFQDVRRRLKPDGAVLVYWWTMSPASAIKLDKTLAAVFPDRPLRVYRVLPHPQQVLYAIGEVAVPGGGSDYLKPTARPAPDAKARVVTDDWPFLYLEASDLSRFLPFLAFVVLFSLGSIKLSAGEPEDRRIEPPRAAVFFLFGAAFMLIETLLIMQVSLLLGHTWRVIGLVITAILLMAFAGNLLVARWRLGARRGAWFAGLIASLLLVWSVRAESVLAFTGSPGTATLLYVTLAALPILFSSVLFSRLVTEGDDLDQGLGLNLLGAMVGGCLEYGALALGYGIAVLLAPTLYLLAAACWWRAATANEASSTS